MRRRSSPARSGTKPTPIRGSGRCSCAQHKDFYGIPIDRGVDVPNAIDNATLRANRFAVDQRALERGLRRERRTRGSLPRRAVRGGAPISAVRGQHFDRAAAPYRDEAAARLMQVSRQRWPAGLAIGDPDIPESQSVVRRSRRWRTRAPLAIGPISRMSLLPSIRCACGRRLKSGTSRAKTTWRAWSRAGRIHRRTGCGASRPRVVQPGGATSSARLTYGSTCRVDRRPSESAASESRFQLCAVACGIHSRSGYGGSLAGDGRWACRRHDRSPRNRWPAFTAGYRSGPPTHRMARYTACWQCLRRCEAVCPRAGRTAMRFEQIEISWSRAEGTVRPGRAR